jgi:Protein of unknown function (DUF4236)
MGLRFRRSERVFPDLRLNFSRSGISTTVGTRGATLTFGNRGTSLNIGLPGTGLSYRTSLKNPVLPPSAAVPREFVPECPSTSMASAPGTTESAQVESLTSKGLQELKKRIVKALSDRIEIRKQIEAAEQHSKDLSARLRKAQSFPVRFFMKSRIPLLKSQLNRCEEDVAQLRSQLEKCIVRIDLDLDDTILSSFATLFHEYEKLKSSAKIWYVTASVSTSGPLTMPSMMRHQVAFEYADSEIVSSFCKALRFSNANGGDLLIYPGFVIMEGRSQDFALLDICDLKVGFETSNFIESESIPEDSRIVSYTWERVNEDGSRDWRFSDNYQIPIARYGTIQFRSSTGLNEKYMFSNHDKTEAFSKALQNYQHVLIAQVLERSSGNRQSNQRSGEDVNVPQQFVEDSESWAYVHYQRGLILCRRIDQERVVLVEPDGGWMDVSPREVIPISKPADIEIITALSGLTEHELIRIPDFCCSPRSAREIEEVFPDVQVRILTGLGMLQEAQKTRGRKSFIWKGWDATTVSRGLDNLTRRSTKINNLI